MADVHAVAENWADAPGWRLGRKRVKSWSIRLVHGPEVAKVRLAGGDYMLAGISAAPVRHASLSAARDAVAEALSARN